MYVYQKTLQHFFRIDIYLTKYAPFLFDTLLDTIAMESQKSPRYTHTIVRARSYLYDQLTAAGHVTPISCHVRFLLSTRQTNTSH